MRAMTRWRGRSWAVAAVMLLPATLLPAACSSSPAGSGDAARLAGRHVDAGITVTSPAFVPGAPVPGRFTCDGGDRSPPLAWRGVPASAAELALVVDDPDAPGGTYVHWVLYGLDRSVTGLAEATVPAGARQAANSAGDARYRGPCPPARGGAHHYRFTVYALDARIGGGTTELGDVLAAIGRAAIAKGTLTGTVDR